MNTWIRPSGTDIELKDTKNLNSLARENGWTLEGKISLSEGDIAVVKVDDQTEVEGEVVKSLKTKIVIRVDEEDVEFKIKDVLSVDKKEG